MSVGVIIYNPAAGGGRVGRTWARLEAGLRDHLGSVDFLRTEHPRHATELARQAVEQGVRNVISLGGDGTHNEVVNGIMQADPAPGVVGFGVLPAGTGGDFARVLNTSRDTLEAAHTLHFESTTPLDVGRVEFGEDGEQVRYFINVATFGIGGLVDRLVNDAPKVLGGKASFFIGTVRALAKYKPALVMLDVDGEAIGPLTINTVAVGNGRYCGGGMMVTPEADPTDGMFEVIIIEQRGLRDMIALTRDIYRGTHTRRDFVHVRKARRVRATQVGPHEAFLDLDGEAPGAIPATLEIVPGALRLLGELR